MVNAWLYGNQCLEMSSALITGIYMYFGIIIDMQLKIGGQAKFLFFLFLNKKHISRNMRFPTMWHAQPAKAQISLRIRAV